MVMFLSRHGAICAEKVWASGPDLGECLVSPEVGRPEDVPSSDQLRERPPRRNVRRPLPPPDVRRGCLAAAGRLGDLGELHGAEFRQDFPSELLRVVDGPGIGLVPTPTAPDAGANGTRLAWPLHEPTELPLGEARPGVQNDALAPAPIDANAATDSAICTVLPRAL